MKYTENEIKMLDAFYNESVDCCGFCDEEQNMSFMNADDLLKVLGGNKQSIGGTMASLLEKGAICDTGESSRGLKLHDFCIVDYDYKEKEEPKTTHQEMAPSELQNLIGNEMFYGFNLGVALRVIKRANPVMYSYIVGAFEAIEHYRHREEPDASLKLIEEIKKVSP